MTEPLPAPSIERTTYPRPDTEAVPILDRPFVAIAELVVLTVLTLKILGGGTELVAIVVMLVLLRLRRVGLQSIGFVRPTRLGRTIIIALSAAVLLLLAQFALLPPLEDLFGPDPSGLTDIRGDAAGLVKLLVLGVLLAPVLEEFMFRGYLLNRIAGVFGGTPAGWRAAAALVTVMFGFFHFYQGLGGVVLTTLGGAVFLTVYFVTGRNLWAAVGCHAFANLLSAIMLYLGWA